MISKILFTLAIVAAVFLLLRWRQQRTVQTQTAVPHETEGGFRWLALATVALMVIGSAIFLFQAWRDMNELLTVHVIDTRSGAVSEYLVYRSDLDGREFRTQDGRRIILAETERLEIGPD